MAQDDRRQDVREDFLVKVTFRILTDEAYVSLKGTGELGFKNAGMLGAASQLDPGTIDFLLQMDRKLDRILALLSQDKVQNGPFRDGTGVDISGSGMRLLTDASFHVGDRIEINFLPSNPPPVFGRIFGKISWKKREQKRGKTLFNAGIRFTDLSPGDREHIVACVFKKQREKIRKLKDGTEDLS